MPFLSYFTMSRQERAWCKVRKEQAKQLQRNEDISRFLDFGDDASRNAERRPNSANGSYREIFAPELRRSRRRFSLD